jgi:predicted Zn finger-like uncharacterized protein
MALATQCPHCDTTFRVASDQLKLRGGIVRCGACQHVFDGNAGLVDLDQLAEHPEPQAGAPDAAVPQAAVPDAEAGEVPVFTLDFDAALDPLGILPTPETGEAEAAPVVAEPDDEVETVTIEIDMSEAEAPHPEPAAPPVDESAAPEPVAEDLSDSEPVPATHPDKQAKPGFAMGSALLAEPEDHAQHDASGFARPVDEELVAAALPHEHEEPAAGLHAKADAMARTAAEPPALLLRESTDDGHHAAGSAPAGKPRSRVTGRRSKLTPTRIAPPKLRVPEIDEPDFVKRGRQREQSGKRTRILMAAGSLLLVLLLAVQAATTFGNVLAARYPALKPALASACALLRCRVDLPARIENLAIETGELQTVGENTYVLTTLLHNQGGLAQAWPAIELTLSDANDKPLVRRVFTPAEYLPKGLAGAAGFGARAEQPVKLYFQLDQLKPSGYHIIVFYP